MYDVLERAGYVRHGLDSDWDLLWAHEYPFRVLRDRLTRLGPHQKVLFVFLLRVPSGSNCLAWIVSGFVLKLEMFLFLSLGSYSIFFDRLVC